MVLSYFTIAKFFEDELSLIKKGEDAFNCNHVIKTNFDTSEKHYTASVMASMKDKSYKVQVRQYLYTSVLFAYESHVNACT